MDKRPGILTAEQQADFQRWAERLPSAVFLLEDWQIYYANPAAARLTDLSLEDLQKKPFWEIIHPSYQDTLMGTDPNRLVTGENLRHEIMLATPSGTERWASLTIRRFKGDSPEWLIVTAFDLTENFITEHRLRQIKDQLEKHVSNRGHDLAQASRLVSSVLEVLPVAVWITDSKGHIIQRNIPASTLWGRQSLQLPGLEDLLSLRGRNAKTGKLLTVEDWPLSRALFHGETVIGEAIDIPLPGGRPITLLFSAAPIFNDVREIGGVVAVAQDITTQRELERQAKQAAEEARRRLEELNALHRSTAALVDTLDLDALLERIIDAAQSVIPATERGWVHLISPETGQLQLRESRLYASEKIKPLRMQLRHDVAAQAVRERRPLLFSNMSGELPGSEAGKPKPRSAIVAPLFNGPNVIGALSLVNSKPSAFKEDDLRLLVSFAATVSVALNNALLHAQVQRLAVTDTLTGLYNRRALFDLGERELERSRRMNTLLSAIMIDVDNFKSINDTYGHATGDQVLQAIADTCQRNIRQIDILGRYGGDEYALVLPDTGLSDAQEVAKRILNALHALDLKVEGSSIRVQVSLGVAQIRQEHRSISALLDRADAAMYSAKQQGGDQVDSAS